MTQPTTDASRRRYLFQNRLGVGGFGEVYRATMYTGAVQMQVAVKLLREEYGVDEQAGLRLRDEARFLSALRHPSIIKIFDLVKLAGRLALVTEYADGEDLRWVLHHGGRLPPRAAAEVLARVADALSAAATANAPGSSEPMNLIHRDVKPANIHLGRHGGVTLLDFGIARSDALEREAKTAAYAIVGSGPYTPPEILMREPPTSASDVWSLAVTIYEALSGERLFPDHDMRDLARLFIKGEPKQHITERVQVLDAPEEIRQLLLDMLEVEAEDRPTAVQVMKRADDLADGLGGTSLRRWAMDREWLPIEEVEGDLEGMTLEEEPLFASIADSMPPSTPLPEARKTGAESPELSSPPSVDFEEEPTASDLGLDDDPTDSGPAFKSDFDDDDDWEEAKTVVATDPSAWEEESAAALHLEDDEKDTDPGAPARDAAPTPIEPAPQAQAEQRPAAKPAPVAQTGDNRGGGTRWLIPVALLLFLGFVVLAGLGGVALTVLPGTNGAGQVDAAAPDAATARAQAAPQPDAAPSTDDEPAADDGGSDEPAGDEPTEGSQADGSDDDSMSTANMPGGDDAPEPEPAAAPEPAPAAPSPRPAPRPRPSPAPAPAPAPASQPAPAPAPVYSTRPTDFDVGKITFKANVIAEISVDGEVKGNTPITVTMSPGTHEFKAMIPGVPASATGGKLDIKAGTNQQLNLNFSQK